ncbi:MAG TPA: aspartate-semialdehyde dehydrogenase [Candidatus Desulfofervidus auxilii]|uniref:Aspartate-semialdehyde dehydrogenase n=1 Tax=Desulfofervidus auxilii TaxID=1621989 RepID=A0A7V0NE74_DESA2|nr:aspartate-semialdehyde dehydrogenase [Candidatus Desulfofervidus auxilii]
MIKEVNVAVVGATGAVGNEMIRTLEQRNFPVKRLRPLASERSLGKKVNFHEEEVPVEVLKEDSFKDIDIALFSAGASISKQYAPLAAAAGAVVVDNSSAFRQDPDIPLVVPEVNPHAIVHYKNRGIVSNPNCSTIQMVVALKPIHDVAKIKRVVVATYQAVSGTGLKAIDELEKQVKALFNFQPISCEVYPHQIAFNCLPHIDIFFENGYTKEEMKMYFETRKIMEDDNIVVSATCVRVPVFYSHSEAVHMELEKPLSVEEVRTLLQKAPGIKVVDDPEKNLYPLAIEAAGKDEVFVGRIRKDLAFENGIAMWVVADNVRKGAALNAVQIAEILLEKYL